MSFTKEQFQDLEDLRQQFYLTYDHSSILNNLKKLQAGGSELRPLGEGRFFRAYFAARERTASLPLVLSIAKLGADDENKRYFHHWFKAMEKLPNLPLIPPFELIRDGRTLAWVSPFGDDHAFALKKHWRELATLYEDLRTSLAATGLVLGDVAQFRYVKGIPFICDFSDLYYF